jgi:serine protease Do
MSDVTSSLASDLNLPVKEGAILQTVQKGSPAAKAGLRAGSTQLSDGSTAGGDVIVAIDGKTVKSAQDVVTAIAHKKPGDSVEVEYYRGSHKRTTKVTLSDRPAQLNSPSSDQQQFNIP